MAEIKSEELNRRIGDLIVENGELYNKGVNLRKDRDRYGETLSRIREILREALISNGADLSRDSVGDVLSTSEMASKLAAIAGSLRRDLHNKRVDRIGDAEKAGAYLCRSEKAEARVEELERRIYYAFTEMHRLGVAFKIDTPIDEAVKQLVDEVERSKAPPQVDVRYTSQMIFGDKELLALKNRVSAIEQRLGTKRGIK